MTRPDSTRRPGKVPPTLLAAAAAMLALAAAIVVGLLVRSSARPSSTTASPRTAAQGRPAAASGDQACRKCHATETRRYHQSGHASTLRRAELTDLMGWLEGRRVNDPEEPNVHWTYARKDGRLVVERQEADHLVDRLLVDFALGSGRHAMTFVSLTDETDPKGPSSLEHRLTYFAGSKTLGVTPGQHASEHSAGVNPLGRSRAPRETLVCFACHCTTVSAHSPAVLDVTTMRANVGCERCHGPGSAHVDAAERGLSDLSMPRSESLWTAEGQMQLCGQCHRHPSQAPPGQIRADNPLIVRFQPVGLMQSKCYTKSEGALGCTNCHDPHGRVSTDQTFYESVCLDCHRAGKSPVCSVSPAKQCVGCHMPARNSGEGLQFTDHWIRVRKTP